MVSPRFARGTRGAPRIPLLGAFLVLTVALAAWLGWEAVAAAGSHRQTAESVLRDYAEISLAAFTSLAADGIDDVLDEVFDGVDGMLRGPGRIPYPGAMAGEFRDAARDVRCRHCHTLESPLLLFSVDLGSGAVMAHPDTVSSTRLVALAEAVVAARPDIERYGQGLLLDAPDGLLPDSTVLGYAMAIGDGGSSPRVMGFLVRSEALGELFGAWFDDDRLLPEPVGGDLPNDSLLRVTVRSPTGATVWASPIEYSTTLASTRALGPDEGRLEVEVAIRPDQASQLIIGGLPSSRIPLLVTLLVLTLGVGVAALVQFRQEARFQRLRDDFVSGVSHELRTPLAQIRMFAELQDTGRLSDPEDRARATAVIHREARRLSHLVENILQFSRLRYADGPDLPRERVELGDALTDGVDAASSVLRERSMRLTFDAEPGVMVRANRDALTRIVVNLLDNAAKYGPEGQVVRVDVRRVGDLARLTVDDEGPGVPPADRERVWKAYRRLERDVKARLPGTGIGLAVVAELVAMHGGRARVEEAPGGGARFVVDLPLAEPVPAS